MADVTTQIAFLEAYKAEKKMVKSGAVTDLKNLGKKLLDRARNTDLSTYSYEHTKYNEPNFDLDKPEMRKQIIDHEAWVDAKRAELKKAYHTKKAVLDDHLLREQYAVDTRTLAHVSHLTFFLFLIPRRLMVICSISLLPGAMPSMLSCLPGRRLTPLLWHRLTSLFFSNIFRRTTLFLDLCLLLSKHLVPKFWNQSMTRLWVITFMSTLITSKLNIQRFLKTNREPPYNHEEPDKKQQLNQHLSDIANHWSVLKSEEEERKRVLDDHLARETFADKVRRMNEQHKKQFETFEAWVAAKTQYLTARAKINSVHFKPSDLLTNPDFRCADPTFYIRSV